MTLDIALRATEILLAAAFLQQCCEHIFGTPRDQLLFGIRAVLAGLLLAGVATPWVLVALSLHSIAVLHRFGGPYNGGSDRMGLLILFCLTLAQILPGDRVSEAVFAYLAFQVILSYFISGRVKIVNPDWRSGRALQDVFAFSAYPVSDGLRGLADRPRLLWALSWAVMVFELLFPLSLLNQTTLIVALALAMLFHLANAGLFGLNRFVWAWAASYPSILWLQDRLIAGG